MPDDAAGSEIRGRYWHDTPLGVVSRLDRHRGLERPDAAAYGVTVLRSYGARLAVPLLLATIVILVALDIAQSLRADATDGCRPTPTGIDCSYSGSTSTDADSNEPGVGTSAQTPPPPLRYLATSGDRCWYWSRYPPGFDSWDSAYDQSIIFTRWRLPECTGRSSPPAPAVVIDASAWAWAVFRSFPLDKPRFRLSPETGITNLAARLHLDRPNTFAHGETLPDGRRLEVQAWVHTIWVEWSDGTPSSGHSPGLAVGDPGAIRHTYRLKTCPLEYRTSHLDGPKCHPVHDRYPVTITLDWTARYRAGDAWQQLGSIDRTAVIRYDVDEVLGVLQPSGES